MKAQGEAKEKKTAVMQRQENKKGGVMQRQENKEEKVEVITK